MSATVIKPASQPDTLLRTPLFDLHVAQGGKMVPFAGYSMPVQYDGLGVLKEHLYTRSAAGLFDVSHMGQALLYSPTIDPAAALEQLVPGDIIGLQDGQQRYTLLLNDNGGIIDDMMVARLNDHTLFLVVNAACKEKDFAHLRAKIGNVTSLTVLDTRALLALQGPLAEKALSPLFPEITKMRFMDVITTKYEGHDVYISRSGYTGEDGFEISLPQDLAAAFTQKLLGNPDVKLIGLGARDSLRLEAGLCLYGHDLDENTTPVEANLKWTIGKRRREAANFAGAEKIMAQMTAGATRLRVGLKPEGRAPMREGTPLVDSAGNNIGTITSGGFGPSVDGPVAMGYIDAAFSKSGAPVFALLRGEPRPVAISALPFTPHRYKKD